MRSVFFYSHLMCHECVSPGDYETSFKMKREREKTTNRLLIFGCKKKHGIKQKKTIARHHTQLQKRGKKAHAHIYNMLKIT